MTEFEIIKKHFRPLSTSLSGSFSLTDDAAVLDIPNGMQLVCTKDAMSESVHFFKNDEASSLAQKLLAANLSDLAAMGATPLGYLLALCLPRDVSEEWIKAFSEGLKISIDTYGGTLIGGDTITHDGPLVLSLTALGIIPNGKALLRSGAKVGDLICVSGSIGDAYLALQYLKGDFKPEFQNPSDKIHFLSRYYIPTPRLELGIALRDIASACMDISDGLVADLTHLCTYSQVGAEIHLESIPYSPLARQYRIDKTSLITGGDDYELLFTLPPEKKPLLTTLPQPVTIIGTVTEKSEINILDAHGKPITLSYKGFQHNIG